MIINVIWCRIASTIQNSTGDFVVNGQSSNMCCTWLEKSNE